MLGEEVDLASIHDPFEQRFLAQLADGRSTWIGLNIGLGINKDDDWGWVGGSRLGYTNWAPNEPSGDGKCVYMDEKRRMKWNDRDCIDDENVNYVTNYMCQTAAIRD
uniref:C-type lectin domain-containing protein n=1 Tax=Acrobeloides nanus TaxID=290746 RepID=A0A914DZW1_9BILA